jgi:hypothetical protein
MVASAFWLALFVVLNHDLPGFGTRITICATQSAMCDMTMNPMPNQIRFTARRAGRKIRRYKMRRVDLMKIEESAYKACDARLAFMIPGEMAVMGRSQICSPPGPSTR